MSSTQQPSAVDAAPDRPGKGQSVGSWVLGILVSGILLYYSLRGIQWQQVWDLLASAQWRYLAAGGAITCGTLFLRSLRWRVLLNASAHFSVATVFWATMAGYLGNNFLPARAGELVRSFLISSRSSLSKTYVLTTALTERLADAITLVLCGSVILLGVEQKPAWMNHVSGTTTIAAVLGVVFIAVLPRIEGIVRQALQCLPLPVRMRHGVAGLLEQIVLGLRVFHHPARLLNFTLLTLLIWAGDSVCVMVCVHALKDLQIAFPVALLLLVGLGLGSAIPSTPGYIGVYQFVAVTVLTPFGIDRNSAIAFIILFQALNYVVVLVLGPIGLYRLRKGA